MKDFKAYIIVGVLSLVVYIAAQYNKPRPIIWKESYSRHDKIPYGTLILYTRLKDFFPNATIRTFQTPPYVTFKDNKIKSGSYILVADNARLDEFDFKILKNYIQAGNTVFLACNHLGPFFSDTLKTEIESNFTDGKKTQFPDIKFLNPKLDSSRTYHLKERLGEFYFSSFDTTNAIVIGMNEKGKANFLRYTFGKGNLYILAGASALTNYSLLDVSAREYVERVISYIPPSKEVIWDDFSALGSAESESPLRVFLRFPSLRWCYYTAVFTLILFVFYEVKRRQRIIPVIEPLKNTTTEFISVVGQVYYQQRNNINIAEKKATYLLEEIRSKYQLKTSILNRSFADSLIKKSGVPAELVFALIGQINNIRSYTSITDHELIELNKNIELFHQQSR